MKITKTELKEMIREALREELTSHRKLKEHHYPELEDWFCDECDEKMDYERMNPVSVDDEELLVCDKCYDKLKAAGKLEESKSELPDSAYVLKAADDTGECFLNIDLSADYVDFSPVDSISELTKISYSCTKNEAIAYAKEAYNLTIRDWSGEVSVLKVINFRDAYLGTAKPKYTKIY